MPTLCAGLASIDITPSVGTELSGGAFGPATAVLHPLTATALYLTDGFTGVVVISADVIGFDTDYAEAIRGAAARRVGVPVAHVLLTATHTHGGPATAAYRNWGAPDAAYRQRLRARLVELADQAAASPCPVTLAAGYGACPGIAANRVVDGTPADDQVGVLRVENLDGRPLAVVVNFAVHPVTLHGTGFLTPDYIHHLREALRRELDPEVEVLFLLGAAGDVDPTGFVFADPAGARDNARRVGLALADAVVKTPTTPGPAALAAAETAVDLPLTPLPDADTLRAEIARREAELPTFPPLPTDWGYCATKTRLEWASEALAVVESGAPQPAVKTIRLHGLRLGPALAVGLPGELFNAFGQRIKAASSRVVLVAAQTDGSEGYFPDRNAYVVDHYEATLCPKYCGLYGYDPAVGEVVTEAAVRLVRALDGRAGG